RKACGYTQESFAEAMRVDRTTVYRWERGEADPQPHQRPKIAKLLKTTADELDRLLAPDSAAPAAVNPWNVSRGLADDDELDAWELARRVAASDVGARTLERLERAFDDLATAYPVTPPQDLLRRVRRYSAYVAGLLGGKKTLSEHRRLLVVGGWLSLL
ncbi:helix-turn-helix transcriptional regulator, partial [Streptomyces sp. MCAF7]